MLSGFCTTSPCIWPLFSASMNTWLGSKPMKAILPALPMSCSASSIPCVDDSLTQKIPCSSLAYRFSRFSEVRLAVSRVAPAY